MKLTKMLDLLARPREFEPLSLGLEMRGIDHTNDIVLHRFVFYNIYFTTCLQKWLKDSITYPSKLGTRLERKEINFYPFSFQSRT